MSRHWKVKGFRQREWLDQRPGVEIIWVPEPKYHLGFSVAKTLEREKLLMMGRQMGQKGQQ